MSEHGKVGLMSKIKSLKDEINFSLLTLASSGLLCG